MSRGSGVGEVLGADRRIRPRRAEHFVLQDDVPHVRAALSVALHRRFDRAKFRYGRSSCHPTVGCSQAVKPT